MRRIAVFIFLISLASPVCAADTPAIPAATQIVPNQIVINEYMFGPNMLTVVAGTKVTWVNHDEVPHTIVDSSPTKVFHSGALDTNDSYSYVFSKPGTYHYFCTLHPQMVGTITVTAAP